MVGFRKCARCKKELPEEAFPKGDRLCRRCQRETDCRIAPGITAAPREQWAKDLLARMRATW